MARRSAVGLKKRMGSEAPHETVLWVPRRSTVSGSWSLGKPEKAGAVLAGGTSQKNYKKAQIRRGGSLCALVLRKNGRSDPNDCWGRF